MHQSCAHVPCAIADVFSSTSSVELSLPTTPTSSLLLPENSLSVVLLPPSDDVVHIILGL